MTLDAVTLTDFLLARIAEDEDAAQAATPGPWYANGDEPQEFDDAERVLERSQNWQVGTATGVVGRTGTFPGVDRRGDVVSNGWASDPAGGARRHDAEHIARHDPARVLSECRAKRRIVKELRSAYESEDYYEGAVAEIVLETLALPYADHPDYRQEWAP